MMEEEKKEKTESVRRNVGPILCIALAVFDPHKGPTIALQEPRGMIEEPAFHAISDYVIPKPQLYNKLVVV